jgi:S1-C subfamily serine protease
MPEHSGAAELTPAEIFAQIAPSVYLVVAGQAINDPKKGRDTLGSAVAVSEDLAITTCRIVQEQHMVGLINDQTEQVFEASVSRSHEVTDRCFLRARGRLRPIAGVRRIADLSVGERVYTIGNPVGHTKTLGEGLISALQSQSGIHYVQTTAPISQGPSGGALVDAKGALIGITTFLLKDAQNTNIAIAAEEFWR